MLCYVLYRGSETRNSCVLYYVLSVGVQHEVLCASLCTVQWECNVCEGYAMYSVYCTVVVQQAVLCAVLCTILYSGSATYVGGMLCTACTVQW